MRHVITLVDDYQQINSTLKGLQEAILNVGTGTTYSEALTTSRNFFQKRLRDVSYALAQELAGQYIAVGDGTILTSIQEFNKGEWKLLAIRPYEIEDEDDDGFDL